MHYDIVWGALKNVPFKTGVPHDSTSGSDVFLLTMWEENGRGGAFLS